VDWEQATKVFKVLLISPMVGFGCAALLFLLARLIKYPSFTKRRRPDGRLRRGRFARC
jgi:inorganic phosphate transporter, PiT family